MAYLPDLGQMLRPGDRFTGTDSERVVERHDVGEVVFPTGQVVGCDALVSCYDAPPFTTAIAPGGYPLSAWVAVFYRNGVESDRRVAALQLVIGSDPVTSWEPALVEGQDPARLGEDEFFGYPVDSGTATLADATALRAMAAWDYERIEDVFIPAQIAQEPVPGLTTAVTDEATGANVVIVSSGYGDGVYPTFLGYSEAGRLACMVTDFMILRSAR